MHLAFSTVEEYYFERKMETREQQIERENALLNAVRFRADAIAHLIVNTDLPWVDITIQIERFRTEVHRLYPDKDALFEMIYNARFHRLWQDWRTTPTNSTL